MSNSGTRRIGRHSSERSGCIRVSRTKSAQDYARENPYVAFGLLLMPVTYGVTGDPMTALFTGGIVAVGPQIAEGFQELNDDGESGGGGGE